MLLAFRNARIFPTMPVPFHDPVLCLMQKKVITQEFWEAGLYTLKREGILISCSIIALDYPVHFSFEFILWIFRPCQQNTREYIPVFFKILSIN
jgi:hypothetical protein